MTEDKWVPHNEDIKVDIGSLKDFADHIKDEMEKNFRPSFDEGIKPMLMVRAPFGAGDAELHEGRYFAGRHSQSTSEIAEMLGEAMRGLAALSTAAMSIQAEYLMGDAFAEASFDDAFNAFTSMDGQKTLQDYWEQPDNADDKKTTDANTVPAELTDPDSYNFGNDDGSGNGTGSGTSDIYDATVISPGEAGEYHIDGDNEDTHNKKYDMPTPDTH
jgi:hypothetical protein